MSRQHQPAFLVDQAQQRFVAAHFLRLQERRDRLAKELEVALFERDPQPADDRDVVDAAVDARIVDFVRLNPIAAAILGGFARDLRRSERVVEAALAAAHGGSAEGDRKRNRIGADGERHGAHGVAQLVADRTGAVERTIGEEDREAVTGQATEHGIAAGELRLQGMRYGGDDLVAGFEAEQIVDHVQLVDVAVQDRGRRARVARPQAPLDESLDAAARQQAGHRIRRQRDDLRQLMREQTDGPRVVFAERLLLHRAEDQRDAGELRLVVLDRDGEEAADQRTVRFVAHAVADHRLGPVAAFEQEGIGDAFQNAAHLGGVAGGAVEVEMIARGRRERDGVTRHALLRLEEELSDRRGR